MAAIFPVPMARKVILMLLAFAAFSAGAAVWSFGSGFVWTGICVLAVAVPIIVLYWFMIVANPANTRIMVEGDALLVDAPPFFKASQPLAAVSRAFVCSLADEAEFAAMQSEGSMAFFGYRSGVFRTAAGREAVVVARGDRVLCLETPQRIFLLGPADVDGLAAAVGAVVPVGQG